MTQTDQNTASAVNRMRFPWKQILLLLFLPALLGTGTACLHPQAPSWSKDTPAEGEVTLAMVDSWEQRPLWVDARSRREFEREHVPGAVLLTEHDWHDQFVDFLDRWIHAGEPTVVVYCGSHGCRASHQVAERLKEETGSEDIYVLRGGWDTWKKGSP